MRVHRVGRAGDERHQVQAGLGGQLRQLVGLDHVFIVHAVGHNVIEHVDVELVAHLELVEAGEQLGRGQAAVTGEHAVAALAPDGQGRLLDMPHALGEHVLGGAVQDG